jgi:ubiquinol-cytochrome c reductase iron-sulfur subunit
MSDDHPDVPPKMRTPRKIGRRTPLTPETGAARGSTFAQVGDIDTHVVDPELLGEHEPEPVDPREDKFAEWQVSALFVIAALAAVGFVVAFVLVDPRAGIGRDMNLALGGTLAVSLLAIGAGFCLWAKKLLPHRKVVQERHDFFSPEEEELAAEDDLLKGFGEMGIGSRKVLRRSLLTAAALLPLPAVVLLRDLGPLPHTRLRHTGWGPNVRLVEVESGQPIKPGDLEIGGIATVMPFGLDDPDAHALAPTILIRFAPGEIKSKKEATWGVNDHVAYSKICSHAGCPISLYEQQTHHLLCPCHQSTFDMANDANVIFGPAARRLPQLRLDIDADGYFVAAADYDQPVGPSFWERG